VRLVIADSNSEAAPGGLAPLGKHGAHHHQPSHGI
jgi:hypothetical protein